MNQGEILLRAILEDPADTLARLAYADWLEESGDEQNWGTFIRLQNESYSPVECRQEPKLLNDCSINFLLGSLASVDCYPCLTGFPKATWARGFVESVECDLKKWMDSGLELVKRQPVLRVSITDRRVNAERIRATSGWSWTTDYAWPKDDYRRYKECLPKSIWELVNVEYNLWIRRPRDWPWTPNLAQYAMEHAALMVMRERAGLPLWEWKGRVT